MRTAHEGFLRKSVVVFQFAASVFLIVGAVVVYQQLRYMRNQHLGVDISQTLVIKGPGVTDSLVNQKIENLKDEVLQLTGIKSVSTSTNVPGDEIFWASGIKRLVGGPESFISGYTVGIDDDYVPSFGLEVIAGRNYDRDHLSDNKAVLLNRAMTESLDFKTPEEAIGEKIIQGDTFEIIGVLENYHQMSLKECPGVAGSVGHHGPLVDGLSLPY